MFFAKDHKTRDMFDPLARFGPHRRNRLEKSWAKLFREERGGPHPSDRGVGGLRCRSGVGFMPPRCFCPAVQEVRADRSMPHRG